VVSALAHLELFGDVPPETLAAIEARLTSVHVAPGETLMRQGEPGDRFALIVEGEATVSRSRGDEVREVGTLGPGSIVGELALLRAGERTATVTAKGAVTALAGDADTFVLLADAPGVRGHFGRIAAQRLATNARPVPGRLRDGTDVGVRPVLPVDRAALDTAFERQFSPASQRRRFFTPGRPSAALVSYLVDVDYIDHFAWVVMVDGRGVASGRYIRVADDPLAAEIALGVLDEYQGRGVGSFLLGALAAAAPVGGVHRFTASVLSDNSAMRAMLDRAGAHWEHEEPGVVTATLKTSAARALLDEETAAALEASAHDIITAASLALA
jgi:CRP-like cAMP-binding protein